MKEPAVLDSTCLIGLDQVGHLELLPNLFDPVLIPLEVERESSISAPWLRIEAPYSGLLPWIKPVLNELTEKGFRLSDGLKREALLLSGEL